MVDCACEIVPVEGGGGDCQVGNSEHGTWGLGASAQILVDSHDCMTLGC